MKQLNRRRFLGATAAVAGAAALARAEPATQAVTAAENKPGNTPHTRFAVNIEMWWNKLPVLDRMRKAAELGFPAIEFWTWQGRPIEEMRALADELNLQISQFVGARDDTPLNRPEGHADFLKAIEASCQTAKKLNAKKMCVLVGQDVKGMSRRQMHDNVITGLKLAAPIVEQHQVMIIIEPLNTRVNHPGYCLSKSEDAIRICREVDSPMVKINWDLYHLQIAEGDLCGHIREGLKAGQIGYFQLADTPGRHEPGTGEIHYNRVLKEIYDLGYRGCIGLECRPRDGEETAAQRVAAADVW